MLSRPEAKRGLPLQLHLLYRTRRCMFVAAMQLLAYLASMLGLQLTCMLSLQMMAVPARRMLATLMHCRMLTAAASCSHQCSRPHMAIIIRRTPIQQSIQSR